MAAQAVVHGSRIAVIPAGERWPDGTLRPCVEDLIGAGAVIAAMTGTMSPEAEGALATFIRFNRDLLGALGRCGSGKELIEIGFELDVELAAEYGASATCPVLARDRFVDSLSYDLD